MNGKALLYTALVSLTVVVAYDKYGSAAKSRVKIGQ